MVKSIDCQIQVKGHLSTQWRSWFGGLEIENQADGNALLCGILDDQAALYGVLNRIRDLGLFLLSIKCVETRHVPENGELVEDDDVRHQSTEKQDGIGQDSAV